MCMATPVRIKSKVKSQPLTKFGAGKSKVIVEGDKEIDISLVPDAKVGDWLLVHDKMAVNKISETEAQNIFSLIKKCDHCH